MSKVLLILKAVGFAVGLMTLGVTVALLMRFAVEFFLPDSWTRVIVLASLLVILISCIAYNAWK